jgi:hypothetical protein
MLHCKRPVNPILMMRTRGLSGPFAQDTGKGCIKTVGNRFDMRAPAPVLGDGWTQEGARTFEYNTATEQYPALGFPIAVGHTYRVVGACTILTGTAPKLTVRLGYDITPNMFEITATGAFDETAKAGAEIAQLRFIVNDNAGTLRAVLKDLYIFDLG